MTLTDAVIALLLTVRIHGTDEAVRATAKRCAKQLPRSKRDYFVSTSRLARTTCICGVHGAKLESLSRQPLQVPSAMGWLV